MKKRPSILLLPDSTILLIVVANLVNFLLCCYASGTASPPGDLLYRNGALDITTIEKHEYWRLIAAGFLHVDPFHIISNMVSLIIMAPYLEKRVGSAFFLVIYFGSLIGASTTSVLTHHQPYLGVGASGAIFGVMAALFALWILGKVDVSPAFFLINFSLNLASAMRTPRLDWQAHAGGFVSGLIICALLDALSRVDRLWLRSKFPEFAKLGMLACLLGTSGLIWGRYLPGLRQFRDLQIIAGAVLVMLLFVKAIDVLLSKKHGLAGVVLVLSTALGALGCAYCGIATPALNGLCARPWAFRGIDFQSVRGVMCGHIAALPMAFGAVSALFILMALSAQLRRGIKDTGFVAPTFVAERRRQIGL